MKCQNCIVKRRRDDIDCICTSVRFKHRGFYAPRTAEDVHKFLPINKRRGIVLFNFGDQPMTSCETDVIAAQATRRFLKLYENDDLLWKSARGEDIPVEDVRHPNHLPSEHLYALQEITNATLTTIESTVTMTANLCHKNTISLG